MSVCLQCGQPVPLSPTRPRRFCSGGHWKQWRRRNPGAPLPAREGAGAKWEALRDAPAMRSELGPALPLDGRGESAQRRARNARILAALRDGVGTDALCERFGISAALVHQIASRARIPVASGTLPFGAPAP